MLLSDSSCPNCDSVDGNREGKLADWKRIGTDILEVSVDMLRNRFMKLYYINLVFAVHILL